MKRVALQTLQTALQKQWEALILSRKAFANTRRGYLEREQLWPDQVRSWLEHVSAIRKPLISIASQLTNSERLPQGFATCRYPVLEAVHQYDAQLEAFHRLLFPHRLQRPAGAEVLYEIVQHLEAQARSWAILRLRYRTWCAALNRADMAQSELKSLPPV